jgi:hypothetical protein
VPNSHVVTVLSIVLAIGAQPSGCRDIFSPSPRAGPWPNEPSQFALISDYGFADPIPATPDELLLGVSGWYVQRNPVGSGSAATDQEAPFSPASVYQVKYPIGFVSGLTPSTLQYYLLPSRRELYWGFWWKPSNPFQSDGSGVNKIVFLWTQTVAGNSTDLLYFDLSPNPWRIRGMNDLIAGAGPTAGQRLEPNVDTTVVALGEWHRIEIYAKYSLGDAANGVLQWWVDGQLNGYYRNLRMVPDGGFRYLQIAPTFGGNTGDVKLQDDYYWFDHLRVSHAPNP